MSDKVESGKSDRAGSVNFDRNYSKSGRGAIRGDIRRAYLRSCSNWKKTTDLRRASGGFALRING